MGYIGCNQGSFNTASYNYSARNSNKRPSDDSLPNNGHKMALTPADICPSLDNREVQLPAYTGVPLAARQVKQAASPDWVNQIQLKKDVLAARTLSDFQALVERFKKLEINKLIVLLETKNRNGNTPLHFAARVPASLQLLKPFLDMLEPDDRNRLMEIENKAGITPRDNKTTLGYEAEARISKKAFYRLKKDALAARKLSDFKALKGRLAKLGKHNLVVLLVAKDKHCNTPLHVAAKDPVCLQLLHPFLEKLERDHLIALLTAKDKHCNTPLHVAAKDPLCLQLLHPFLEKLEPDDKNWLMKLKNKAGIRPRDYEIKDKTPSGNLPALHDKVEAGHYDNDILSNTLCELSATAYDDIFEPFDLSNFDQVNRPLHQEPHSPLSVQASSTDRIFGNNTDPQIEYWRSSPLFLDMENDEKYLQGDWGIDL